MDHYMKKILIKIILFYQYRSQFTPPKCKYVPSCSTYMLEAIQKYGIIRGGLKGLWRILRCNPFSKGGVDPVK